VARAALAGFSGVVVDRAGYGAGAGRVVAGISRIAGVAPATSPDGRLVFVDLRRLAAELRARLGARAFADAGNAVLHPPRVLPIAGNGLGPLDVASANSRWMAGRTRLTLDNPLARARRVTLSLQATAAGPGVLLASAPDGRTAHTAVSPTPAPLKLTFTLAPGRSTVELRARAPVTKVPDFPSARVHLAQMIVVDDDAQSATSRMSPSQATRARTVVR
jgi:hypothetical protein